MADACGGLGDLLNFRKKHCDKATAVRIEKQNAFQSASAAFVAFEGEKNAKAWARSFGDIDSKTTTDTAQQNEDVAPAPPATAAGVQGEDSKSAQLKRARDLAHKVLAAAAQDEASCKNRQGGNMALLAAALSVDLAALCPEGGVCEEFGEFIASITDKVKATVSNVVKKGEGAAFLEPPPPTKQHRTARSSTAAPFCCPL